MLYRATQETTLDDVANGLESTATNTFRSVGIVVRDIDRSIAFYRDVVGMQERRRFDVPAMHLLEVVMGFGADGGAALVLMHYSDETDRRYVDIGGKLVMNSTDAAGVVEAARASGCEVVADVAPYPGFGLIGFVKDPDGYVVEVIEAAIG